MASIGRDPNGRKRILFVAEDGRRRTVRLGRITMKQAAAFKVKLENLIGGRYAGRLDDETARWIADLPDDIYAKLAAVGLVGPRETRPNQALGPFIEQYIESRVDLKQRSKWMLQQAQQSLIGYFGQDKALESITEADAELWRLSMVKEGLADATIRKRCQHAKQFFARAIKAKLVDANPFTALPSASRPNPARMVFVSQADIEKVIAACPDVQWKVIFALARYGGLRCPSEILALRWDDVNWETGRMLVRSQKTERHPGGESRVVPIFTELRPYLLEGLEQAEEGDEYVITRYRTESTNLRTQAHRIIKRAGLLPWTRTFQNLRSSRETELTEVFPLHVVTAWLGNSQLVAARHYLQLLDEHFERAAHFPAQQPAEADRRISHRPNSVMNPIKNARISPGANVEEEDQNMASGRP
jgi:integrase